jgi:hypothetical protein
MAELMDVSAANALIDAGARLHIAGDEAALRRLHAGVWIGGTIPYFLTLRGGVTDRSRVFVTQLPQSLTGVRISFAGKEELGRIPAEAPRNGFSLVILPGMSAIHAKYALEAEHLPGIFDRPVVGWVAGVHLSELGKVSPKVFNGQTGEISEDRLAVLHAQLPDSLIAAAGIVNVFEQGHGDTIVFDSTGFSAGRCLINRAAASFYDYVKDRKLDLRFPLVADRSGAMINVSFQALDDESRTVKFYAPVLDRTEYRQAAPVPDYRASFSEHTRNIATTPAFSCNCVLNYLYEELEGERPIPISGPATFGEIAYVLLNQTMVYLELHQVR